MKKSLVAVLSVMALLVFTTGAFALHQTPATEYTPGVVKAGKAMIELGGEIRVRGEVNKNVTDFYDDNLDTKQAYDQRVRLGIKANVSPNTMGYLQLESGNQSASTSTSCVDDDGCTDVYESSTSLGSSRSDTWTWGSNNAKPTGLLIRQAYIAHQGSGLLGTMSGVKVGHMLLALGNNLFFDHTQYGDDALILWTTVGGGELAYIGIKLDEVSSTVNDDMDAHVLSYTTAMNGINIGGDLTLLRDHDKSEYDKGTSIWNLGLRGDATIADIKVKADVELQRGKAKEDSSGDEVKFSGYAFMLGAQANLGMASVRLNGAYGSGDKIDSDDKYEGFLTFLSNQQNYTYIYEYKAPAATGSRNTGLQNTWYINLGATANATPDLKISGDVYFLRAAKKVDDEYDSKKIGWEIDGKAEYKLDSNLSYYVEGGYLFAGDLYKNALSDPTEDPDNAWGVRHGILLTF